MLIYPIDRDISLSQKLNSFRVIINWANHCRMISKAENLQFINKAVKTIKAIRIFKINNN